MLKQADADWLRSGGCQLVEERSSLIESVKEPFSKIPQIERDVSDSQNFT